MAKMLKQVATQAGQNPIIGRQVRACWNTYEHVKFVGYARWNLWNQDYIAEIDPYWVFWVDPNDIGPASGGSFDFITDTGAIVDGEWDLEPGPHVEDHKLYHVFKKRFHDEIPWEETSYYKRKARKIRTGESKRYFNLKAFEERLERYDEMYNQFERGNYCLQEELAKQGHTSLPGDGGRALCPSRTDRSLMRHEIAVNIGRDGTMYYQDGRHRLAMAQLAGLTEIPVRIVVRHSQWQHIRDSVAQLTIERPETEFSQRTIHDRLSEKHPEWMERNDCEMDHPDLQIIWGP